MKKTICFVALLTLVAFVAIAVAQQKPSPAPAAAPAPAPAPAPEKVKAEKPKPVKLEKFAGTIDNVDELAKTVAVKGKTETKTFVTDEKTKITRAGKNMPFAELKQGMGVSVDYKKEGEKLIAVSIRAAAPKAAPKAPAEKKPAAAPAPAPAPAAKPAEAPKK
jgi:hypothetical protein